LPELGAHFATGAFPGAARLRHSEGRRQVSFGEPTGGGRLVGLIGLGHERWFKKAEEAKAAAREQER